MCPLLDDESNHQLRFLINFITSHPVHGRKSHHHPHPEISFQQPEPRVSLFRHDPALHSVDLPEHLLIIISIIFIIFMALFPSSMMNISARIFR